jgi:hypothetical protein
MVNESDNLPGEIPETLSLTSLRLWDYFGAFKPVTIPRTPLFVLLVATIAAGADKTPPTYQKGTITGWDTRIDVRNGANNTRSYRHTRVYELKATGLIYEIDDCDAFQAGQFSAGQIVDYRVDDADPNDLRIYVRRENGKEYKCKMEGARIIESDKIDPIPAAH